MKKVNATKRITAGIDPNTAQVLQEIEPKLKECFSDIKSEGYGLLHVASGVACCASEVVYDIKANVELPDPQTFFNIAKRLANEASYVENMAKQYQKHYQDYKFALRGTREMDVEDIDSYMEELIEDNTKFLLDSFNELNRIKLSTIAKL